MTEFKHSIVLFSGDDGLPLEFNVRNTNEKLHLKALIEHGGGFCTQNENSVHLISPGTKVLNVDLGKKLVSSSYIHDCVKQNYLLNVNDYVFTISEAQMSDISDEDSERILAQRQSTCKSPSKNIPLMNMEISPIKQPNASNETTPSSLTLPSNNSAMPQIGNSSESFVEGSQEASTSYKLTSHVYYGNVANPGNEKIKTPNGPLENSEEFNPSQSLVFPSRQTDLLVEERKRLILRSPSKPKDSLGGNVRNILSLNSPSKQADLLVEEVRNPLNLLSPSRNIINASFVLPTSSENSMITQKEGLFSSPKRQVDISPIMRATTKKVHKDNINQGLGLPIPNSCEELPEKIPLEKELQESTAKDNDIVMDVDDISQPENQLLPSASPIKRTDRCFENPNLLSDKTKMAHNVSAIDTVVSSSQPENELDNFDNMLLSKALQKQPSQDEESSSQTCTVSSSADALVPSNSCSAGDHTPPLQGSNADDLRDSPNLTEINEEEYIRILEVEVQQILEKPPPRNIQDKITLVKYLCCVRKLTPRIVLESLLSKSNSLEL